MTPRMLRNPWRRLAARSFPALAAVLAAASPLAAQGPQSFSACYVPAVGALYLIKATGLPGACLANTHVEISWSQGGTLADGSVTTAMLADGAVTAAKLAPGVGAGTVTAVTAGSGLTGGTITGSGTIAVDFGGPGQAVTAARSDHTHSVSATNIGVGNGALFANTTGGQNTAVGSNALRNNTIGDENTAVGAGTMDGGLGNAGSFNTAVGSFTLRNTSGDDNTGIGARALLSTTSGADNTAVGRDALNANTTGSRNIAVGSGAGSAATTGSDNIHIGHAGAAAEAATIRLGTPGTQTRAFIAGVRGVTTGVNNGVAVLIDGNGQLGTISSSARFKDDIRDMGDASSPILRLRPVTFRYRQPSADGSQPTEYGLIAEEVLEEFPALVALGADGQPETVRYHLLPALLLNELQRQEHELASLRAELERLGGLVAAQAAALDAARRAR